MIIVLSTDYYLVLSTDYYLVLSTDYYLARFPQVTFLW